MASGRRAKRTPKLPPKPVADPAAFYHEVYDVLARTVGAHPAGREAFVAACAFPPGGVVPMELPLDSALGVTGSFWHTSLVFRVGCHIEDRSPERKKMLEEANEALAPLFRRWRGQPG